MQQIQEKKEKPRSSSVKGVVLDRIFRAGDVELLRLFRPVAGQDLEKLFHVGIGPRRRRALDTPLRCQRPFCCS